MQEIIVYILLAFALLFLVKKYVLPTKQSKGCSSDCNCH
ncbi:hypothetical protein I602_1627 [Polaribacter dokdonensis DSW-5]|uniref:FeoB-associated Cys-rich membrane protein n=1 Tax=Polaribacter dokdonensis DSW-5 TaxID=1300348 RepID=A0A0N0UNP0_9FLAO|nr:hypothetical protein I602_1627 [Polaribacter dokdonensis DSW-5]SED96465.1 hypothetical protein SAMN05444353_0140 [Polaribacter dokdonensis DSW-5]